jgi:hypothetical protein
MERAPALKIANDKWSRRRALKYREQRLRCSNDEHQPYELPEEVDDDNPTPYERKEDCREWYVERHGDVRDTIQAHVNREMVVEDGFVVKHRCRTYENEHGTAVNMRTPSPEPPASTNDAAPATGEDPTTDVGEITLGAFGDKPLEVRSGVAAPAGHFLITDGAADDGEYEPAQHFPTWYGEDGAEHHMRADSIARSFQCIPGEATPWDRANAMAQGLHHVMQSQSITPPSPESLWERRDPWGRREAASLVREMSDSAETAYHNDMYVTSKMANRWKEINWWQIDKRCWEATYGPNTEAPAHLREARDIGGKSWPEWIGEQPYDHQSNQAREMARKTLERDLNIPDFKELVGATVGHRISIAAEIIMAHTPVQLHLPEPCAAEGGAICGRAAPPTERQSPCRQLLPEGERSD